MTTEHKETLTALLDLSETNRHKLATTINNAIKQLTRHHLNVTQHCKDERKRYICELEQHQINPDFIKPIAPMLPIPKLLGLELGIAAHQLALGMILHVSSKTKDFSFDALIAKIMGHVSKAISLYELSNPESWSPIDTEFVSKYTLFKSKHISQVLIEEINQLTTKYKDLSAPIENQDSTQNSPKL